MTDELVLKWLIGMTTYIVNLHNRIADRRGGTNGDPPKYDNRGPRWGEDPAIPWEEEGFSRWMGWRGQAAQEEEIHKKRKNGRAHSRPSI